MPSRIVDSSFPLQNQTPPTHIPPNPPGFSSDREAWVHFQEMVNHAVGWNTSFAVIDLSAGSSLAYVSPSMLDLFEYENDQILGLDWSVLTDSVTDDDEQVDSLQMALNSQTPSYSSRCMMCRTGRGNHFWGLFCVRSGLAQNIPFACLTCLDVSNMVESDSLSLISSRTSSSVELSQIETNKNILDGLLALIMGEQDVVTADTFPLPGPSDHVITPNDHELGPVGSLTDAMDCPCGPGANSTEDDDNEVFDMLCMSACLDHLQEQDYALFLQFASPQGCWKCGGAVE
uniref:PAS domain-containing protein n=1 Tax=Hanusia phi TaxID=3032 RepID=A0A7S0ELR6_9CRYP|mmetsp:Transcript_25015/g.56447  ORF Transcript_25015/g.56447 Transcript_25015/m.56447 type:complete len:288 (+) Transcript_25015:321-1184(+)|eukprot:751158-Hanusia_phi.AAC.3